MNGKWLFQNHRRNMGELLILSKGLESLGPIYTKETDCTPLNERMGAKEKAIPQRNRFSGTINTSESGLTQQEKLIMQFRQCEFNQLLYESVLLTLTDSEKWIVETHFVAGRTITETLALIPENMLITSRSSLIRRINKLLNKADSFLADHSGNSEEMSECIYDLRQRRSSTA